MLDLIGWSDYLPGETYAAFAGRGSSPTDLLRARLNRVFKFKSKDDQGDYFQQFLAIQQNPEAFFAATVDMPETPFGRMM